MVNMNPSTSSIFYFADEVYEQITPAKEMSCVAHPVSMLNKYVQHLSANEVELIDGQVHPSREAVI